MYIKYSISLNYLGTLYEDFNGDIYHRAGIVEVKVFLGGYGCIWRYERGKYSRKGNYKVRKLGTFVSTDHAYNSGHNVMPDLFREDYVHKTFKGS